MISKSEITDSCGPDDMLLDISDSYRAFKTYFTFQPHKLLNSSHLSFQLTTSWKGTPVATSMLVSHLTTSQTLSKNMVSAKACLKATKQQIYFQRFYQYRSFLTPLSAPFSASKFQSLSQIKNMVFGLKKVVFDSTSNHCVFLHPSMRRSRVIQLLKNLFMSILCQRPLQICDIFF